MSSHHIVRDAQEPAVLLLDAEVCQQDTLHQLLEWSPVVMATAETLPLLLTWNIKVEVVFCSAEQHPSLKKELIYQEPVTIIPIEGTLFLTIAAYLKEKEHRAINIFFPIDHTLSLFAAFSDVDVVLFEHHQRAFLCKKKVLEKWYPAGQQLCIPENVQVENLTLVGDGVYKVLQDGFVKVHGEGSPFLIMEES
ncbi:hypothetical protein [Algivirga pacifica]|uniref:Thiamine diphosphokinase n=1 Tax=Algivirga pacifica TaxID=1162670 RepID=A0ABP9D844_9BACT